jgi:hypothetical protein
MVSHRVVYLTGLVAVLSGLAGLISVLLLLAGR